MRFCGFLKGRFENNETTEVSNSDDDTFEIIEDFTSIYREALPLEGEATKEEMVDEGLSRLRALAMKKIVIEKYKEGVIMMSDGSGVISELNRGARFAIVNTSCPLRCGFLPYHIIRTRSTYGDLYNVLFVSMDKTKWINGRWPREDGYINATCYNHDEFTYKNWMIEIKLADGAIVRLGGEY